MGVPLTGLSDHFVSEAIYLSDPDGHGIEICQDRPREDIGANTWESEGAKAAPSGAAALRHVTIVLPSLDERERLLRAPLPPPGQARRKPPQARC
jgi:catechol-2,3-dioxygenase